MALHTELFPPTALTAPLRPLTARVRVARRAPGGGRGGRRAAKLLVSGALATGIVALALPRVAGAEWADIATALRGLSFGQLAVLAVIWLAGLWVHTPALTAAMPGLSHRRALLLNLTGSFVSNLLPLGGAAGTVANWRMARSWGFESPAFARWAVLTNLVDTVLKFVLPGLALCWLGVAGVEVSEQRQHRGIRRSRPAHRQRRWSVWLVARDDRAVRWMGRCADRVVARVRFLPAAQEGYAERAGVVPP